MLKIKMRKFFLLLFLVSFIAKPSFCSISMAQQSQSDNLQSIKKLKQALALVNQNIKNYQVKNTDLTGLSAEGGELTAYYQGKVLKKITVVLYGEIGKSTVDYYFNGKDFFYVSKKIFNYNKPMYLAGSKVKTIHHEQYYVANKTIICWFSGAKKQSSNQNLKSIYNDLNNDLALYKTTIKN